MVEFVELANADLAHVLIEEQRLAYMLDLGNCTAKVEGF